MGRQIEVGSLYIACKVTRPWVNPKDNGTWYDTMLGSGISKVIVPAGGQSFADGATVVLEVIPDGKYFRAVGLASKELTEQIELEQAVAA